jgi:hypothetical protein
LILIHVVEAKGGVAGADAGDFAFIECVRRFAVCRSEDGELDGGRSAVNDEQVQVASSAIASFV